MQSTHLHSRNLYHTMLKRICRSCSTEYKRRITSIYCTRKQTTDWYLHSNRKF